MARPKNPNARTATQRAADADAKLVASGGKLTRVRLSPTAAARAAEIMTATGETLTALVERLVVSAKA